jgi:hypothetical protein
MVRLQGRQLAFLELARITILSHHLRDGNSVGRTSITVSRRVGDGTGGHVTDVGLQAQLRGSFCHCFVSRISRVACCAFFRFARGRRIVRLQFGTRLLVVVKGRGDRLIGLRLRHVPDVVG